MAVVIIDSGSGNLRSVQKALEQTRPTRQMSQEIRISSKPQEIARATRLVLPGQGAFASVRRGLDAVDGLVEAMTEAVLHRAVPLLGICVGMQILVTDGEENGRHSGLGWLAGHCRALTPLPGRKIPHMGWNNLELSPSGRSHPLLRGIGDGDHGYFVHSYAVELTDNSDRLASCDYHGPVTAMIGHGTFAGTQFHVEKSQQTGLAILANFWDWRP
ncbi:MAG: imidazole glycerol phosphate synthase subunit HisH [Alphaproteobacteria bacterium]|nr:imidazole glycerol phosphate synthase subunit HisH [Alphaproteobacteria bacterium]